MTASQGSITACILARNEEKRIEEALQSLQGWTDQIIVIDNESEDRTVEIARRYASLILTAPRAANFDAARNLAIEPALGQWIFYLDADERVPPRLGPQLRRLVEERGNEFEALYIPFKHYFCGRWMRNGLWWPGYTRPQLLKKGHFRYNVRLHSGVQVDGRSAQFPADDPDLAIVHHSYEDFHQYLEKLNRYTDGESESLLADGESHSWQAMLAHFVQDWQLYYDRHRADEDGMPGFVLAFGSAFYRFASRVKLWDERRKRGELLGEEPVPSSLREMLEFMARVTQEGAGRWLEVPKPSPRTGVERLPLLWHAPLLDPSGYADEARNFVLGLIEAGEPLALAPANWGPEDAGLSEEVRRLIRERTVPGDTPAELYVCHTLPHFQEPSPDARLNIARTMFETDRLPAGREQALNRMDRIWVPSEFNRETFVRSGVDPTKIAVVPGCIAPEPYAAEVGPWPVPGEEGFRFLTVFDWTLHKGWDVLLEAFAREFGGEPQVGLIVKTWSSNGYTLDDIRTQADALLQSRLGKGLDDCRNIHLWQQVIPTGELPRLYRAVHAFVLPTRGEGWCRPLMEAMAAGLPTIATAWSGLTEFHGARVGYPLKYQLGPVSEAGAREIPIYAGHYWAESDPEHLRQLMRQVVTQQEEARKKGLAAQRHVRKHFSRAAVARILQEELAHCAALAAARPVQSPESKVQSPPPAQPQQPAVSRDSGPRTRDSGPYRPAAYALPRDPHPAVDFRELLGRPLRVRWEGPQSLLSSLALVNRELCLGLLERGDVELSLREHRVPWHTLTERDDPRFRRLFPLRDRPLSGPPDVTVRHHFPPSWERPEAGKLVVIQPWEYGHLPREWVEGAGRGADEVWAYSRFVREVYARSGVPAEKVRVVPLGFNPERFTPEGPAYPLPTEKPLRFLFVGGALERKGADLLLQAYVRAFTRADPVCLVVKDMGTRTFYRGATYGEQFLRAASDPEAPEVLYLDGDLPEAELVDLYRACTCVVLPYRGEGFGLPPLEGMACGLLPIVTAGGPTDDYVEDETGLRVPARRRPAERDWVGPSDDHGFACAGNPWQLEPDLDALVDALRWIRDHPEQAEERRKAAREAVRERWTWETAAGEARARLHALLAPHPQPSTALAVPWPVEAAPAPNGNGATRSGWKPVRGPASPGVPSPKSKVPSQPSAKPAPTFAAHDSGLGTRDLGLELSLCMIVRDEEARLGECLRSIQPYVDEMVVVDTGSRDRTREVARECGARVFDYPWPDSFAEARNRSLEAARGRWLFWMDADDVIPPECGRELRELVRGLARRGQAAAYQVQVRIPPGPGEWSESVVDHVKLFPNRADLRFEHRIHEQILPSIRQAGLPVRFSDLYVVHRNYDRSPEGQARKRLRDFRLLELDLLDHPEHPFVLFNLGMTCLHATREYEVAAHYLRRCLDRSHPSDSIVRKAYAMLATARNCQGDWPGAITANEEGRRHYPDDAELLFQAGQVYGQLGRWDEARGCLERLVGGKDDPHYRSVDVGLRTYRGRHELALLYRRLGDPLHAEQVLKEVLREYSTYLPARLDLVEVLLQQGKRLAAERALKAIPADPKDEALAAAVTRLRRQLDQA